MPAVRRSEGKTSRDGTVRGILVAVHRGHLEQHEALEEMKRSRFDLGPVSVVGTDYHIRENVYGYYSTGRRLEAWGSFGSFWSGVWAALAGGAFFSFPSVGPVLMAGPVVGWLVAALEKGAMVHGLSPLGAALVGQGVPPESMLEYEKAVRNGEFLLITSGPLPGLAKVRSLVESTRARVDVHSL